MKNELIMIGGGSHALSVLSLLNQMRDNRVVGFVDNKKSSLNIPYLGNDDNFLNNSDRKKSGAALIMAIGSDMMLRKKLFLKYKKLKFDFITLIHASALVDESAKIGEGSVLFPGVIVGPKAIIGDNVVLHDYVIIEHESSIGDHCYFSPASTVAGRCRVGESVFFGIHAAMINDLSLASDVTLGAGAILIDSYKNSGSTLVGVPAKALACRV